MDLADSQFPLYARMMRNMVRTSISLATFAAVALLSLPSTAQQVLPLWPHGTPEPPQTTAAEADVTKPTDAMISGHRTARLANVTQPTMTVYKAPTDRADGAAALVFPGGGYQRLSWNGEGTDTCAWLNSIGVTCLLVKYRVPETAHFPDNPADLEDAQQAMRLAKKHASEWNIDPERIGVVGFSAGGHLAVTLSTHWEDKHVASTPAAADADASVSAHPAFAILGYPAYLDASTDHTTVDPMLAPVQGTPPTFIIQAENDRNYINSALAYYRALKDAHISAEMHLYATGGHGFGMHPVGSPEEHWTQTATQWLRTIGMIPPVPLKGSPQPGIGGLPMSPCPVPQAPLGRPDTTPARPQQTTDPSCW